MVKPMLQVDVVHRGHLREEIRINCSLGSTPHGPAGHPQNMKRGAYQRPGGRKLLPTARNNW
jgi:hypothetical protein